jgi:hypothetical protein
MGEWVGRDVCVSGVKLAIFLIATNIKNKRQATGRYCECALFEF